MKTELLGIVPVLPSADIVWDIAWYKEKVGFEAWFSGNMYVCCNKLLITLNLENLK